MPVTSRDRQVRGLVAATFATLTALGMHVLGGGAVPRPVGVGVPWLISAAVCTSLCGRRLRLVGLAASVTTSQWLFHMLFTVGAELPRHPAAGAGTRLGASLNGHHAMPGTGSTMTHGSDALLQAGPQMGLSHAVAATLTTLALYFGDRLLDAIAQLSRLVVHWWRRLTPRLDHAPVVPRRAGAVAPRPATPRWSTALQAALPKRGPPPVVASRTF